MTADITPVILQALQEGEVVRYSQFLTFGDEVNYFWKKDFGLGTALFFLNRYYSLFSSIIDINAITSSRSLPVSDSICMKYFQWFAWGGLIATIIAASIMMARVYALYNLSKRLLAGLVACLLACVSLSGWIAWRALGLFAASGQTQIQVPTGFMCNPQSLGVHLKLVWVPALAFDALLCGLVVHQVLKSHMISLDEEDTVFLGTRRQPLVMLLMRDSVVYFIATCITYLTCTLFMALAPPHLEGVPLGCAMVIPPILCSRMMMNIRENHESRHETFTVDLVQEQLMKRNAP
ncbi:hypothetical protein D9613_008434 [Agrocybe pediades]|uniref:DUF6533 domain-containing protein n=1 Tax=Agrocybe pediades TaxID=84607 RepID=A0A8H4QSB5_9AGAR|nr:hypothetical protein D9613_008434 [Agrocybe pediades]